MPIDLSSAAIGSVWIDQVGTHWKLLYIGRDQSILVRRDYSSIHKANGDFIKDAAENLRTLIVFHSGEYANPHLPLRIVKAKPESA